MKVLVTGGLGFICSNFIAYLLNEIKVEVVNIDKQTYAGLGKNIEHLGLEKNPNYLFIKADICDKELMKSIFNDIKPQIVFNFAAESHVDRSIESADNFANTNIVGTLNLLEAAREVGVNKFIQISTDEVYGSIDKGSFDENDMLSPSSPYSASKASAEHLTMSFFKTHGLPVIITRSANNYGPYQYPEKLLPLFITNLIDKKKVPLMWSKDSPGTNIRDWLHVHDNCRAIWFISQNGKIGEIYNIPGDNEKTNIFMTKKLLKDFKMNTDMIQKVEHRLGHDFRYSIDGTKLKKLGFVYKHKNLNTELISLVKWYKKNQSWWRPLKL